MVKFDVAVIGGGPAGMMAAVRAGSQGQRVVLLEKNQRLGIKLLATGNGRCNLTNRTADQKSSIVFYGKSGKFLMSAFHRFGVAQTLEYFREYGVETREEDGGRIFPQSNQSQDVLQALISGLAENNVDIRFDSIVKKIIGTNGNIEKVVLVNGAEIAARKYILAVGGQSYPGTGSTGDAYRWLEEMRHTVVRPRPILTPLIVREKFIASVEGVSLKNVGIILKRDNKKVLQKSGVALFTADGLSGPAMIDLSRELDFTLSGNWRIELDFLTEYDEVDFEIGLQGEFQREGNKIIKNKIAQFVPARLANLILELSAILPEKRLNEITKIERRALVKTLKHFSLEIVGVKGFERAMVTGGGVDIREVNPQTMQSKIVSNLYFAGEILDLDGPTGGYNLQICWSTGFVAGSENH